LRDRGRPGGFSSIDLYRSTDLTLFPSGSSFFNHIYRAKEQMVKSYQGCEVWTRVLWQTDKLDSKADSMTCVY